MDERIEYMSGRPLPLDKSSNDDNTHFATVLMYPLSEVNAHFYISHHGHKSKLSEQTLCILSENWLMLLLIFLIALQKHADTSRKHARGRPFCIFTNTYFIRKFCSDIFSSTILFVGLIAMQLECYRRL